MVPSKSSTDRRTVLKALGVSSVALSAGLAGCGGDGGGDGDGDGDGDDGGDDGGDGTDQFDATISADEYPVVDDWMTETDVGDADSRYGGAIGDLTGQDSVTVDVGATGNGDGFAFGPSAIAVSTGTEIVWDWTGEGGSHNVVADPGSQIGESDFEFSSGDAISGADNEYTHTFDEAGVALYHCVPHLSMGMKGAVVVQE